MSHQIRKQDTRRAKRARREHEQQHAIERAWVLTVKRVMKQPAALLPPRECWWCVAEAGTARTRGATHGLCARHLPAWQAWFRSARATQASAQAQEV